MSIEDWTACQVWAAQSLPLDWMGGKRGPARFVQALVGGWDADEHGLYASVSMAYAYGVKQRAVCLRLGAEVFSALGDQVRLRLIGGNFQIRRYPTEEDDAYVGRLDGAWDAHAAGGTAFSVKSQLQAYGFVDVQILEEWQHIIAPQPAQYAGRFDVVIGPDFGDIDVQPLVLGDWQLGVGNSYLGCSNFSEAQLDDLARIVLDWRQVHDAPCRIILLFQGAPHGDWSGIDVDAWLIGMVEDAPNAAVYNMGSRRALGNPQELGGLTFGILTQGFGVTHGY